jgi:hypothetical protein
MAEGSDDHATVLEFEEFPGRTLTVLLFKDVPDAG